jgi:rhamnosyltransferase
VPSLLDSFNSLAASGAEPASVGPRLVAPAGEAYKSPRYFRRPGVAPRGDLTPVQYLPTSGSLVSIEAFRRIGPFRGDYFIDGIDLEWCFRAWARGYSCWCATSIPVPHTVGQGVVGSGALGLETPRQHGFRLETYIRNTLYGFRLPHVPWSWKLRQGAYLIIQIAVMAAAGGSRAELVRRLGRGVRDGLRGRLGPPEGAPHT